MAPAQRDTGEVVQSMKDQLNSMYRKVITGTIFTVVIIVFLLLISALPLTALILGALRINNCAVQTMIPIWLIVDGVTGLTMAIIQIVTSIIRLIHKKDEDSTVVTTVLGKLIDCFSSLIGLFFFAWMIVGSVWIFSVKSSVQSTDPTLANYCDASAYNFAFGYVITQLCLIGLMCCLPCIILPIALCIALMA